MERIARISAGVVAPSTSVARQVLRTYVDDVASSYYGRPVTDAEIDAALLEDPDTDLEPPYGVFLVARQRDIVLGCAGLRWLRERVGEVTRLRCSSSPTPRARLTVDPRLRLKRVLSAAWPNALVSAASCSNKGGRGARADP